MLIRPPDQANPTDWMYFVHAVITGARPVTFYVAADGEVTDRSHIAAIERHARNDLHLTNCLVVDWKVLRRPDPTPVILNWLTDDIAVLRVGGSELSLTHDELGTAGLTAVVEVVDTLAARLGFTVTTEGTPGV